MEYGDYYGISTTHHGRGHEAGKDHAMGDLLAVGAQGRGPQEHKGVHGGLEQGLHGAQQRNAGICRARTSNQLNSWFTTQIGVANQCLYALHPFVLKIIKNTNICIGVMALFAV